MPTPARPLPAIRPLDDTTSQDLWNWVLRRQGLAEETRLDSVESIARASLGLHAARLPSPFATVAARSTGSDVATSLFAQQTRDRVMTVRCMRKTLHALPLDLAGVAHAATRHYRERDALRAVVNAQERLADVEGAADDLAALLAAQGPLHHRDIEAQLAAYGISTVRSRLALKLAWERGDVAYLNASDSWNRELRTFALTKQVYPEADLGLERMSATVQLVESYFDRYGPASLSDAVWWSALSRTSVVDALAKSGREVAAVSTSWSEQPQYMFADRLEEFLSTRAVGHSDGVNLLAHEDVALKAYFETRRRYLGNLPPRRAFNQIGEVLPTVLHSGQVIGTWSWDPAKRRVVTSLVSGGSTPETRRAVRARANLLTEILRCGWASNRPGRTVPIPGQLSLLPQHSPS